MREVDRMGRFIWEFMDGPKWGQAAHMAYWEISSLMDAIEANDDRQRRRLMHPGR